MKRTLEVAQLYKIMAYAKPSMFLELRSAYCFANDLFVNAFAQWVGERQFECMADVGCGTGLVTQRISHHAKRTVAVDVSPQMLAEMAGLGIETVVDSLPTLEKMADGLFDVVVSTNTLYYLSPDALNMSGQRMASLLRPGGFLVFNDNWNAKQIAQGLAKHFDLETTVAAPFSIKAKPGFDRAYHRVEPRFLYLEGLAKALKDPGFEPDRELSELMHRKLFKLVLKNPWLANFVVLMAPLRRLARMMWANDYLLRKFCITATPSTCLWVLKKKSPGDRPLIFQPTHV